MYLLPTSFATQVIVAYHPEASSLHIKDVVVACAVFAALLCHHHELFASPLEEKSVLRVQAVHPRALRKEPRRQRMEEWRSGWWFER